MATSIVAVRFKQSSNRLEQIANLRARGISEHIDLPQLVVCGDQSAGKSSVLTGLTGIAFPRDVGLCTRFATEIIMTHADGPTTTTIEIIAHDSSTAKAKKRMKSFKRDLKDFSQLPQLIAEATTCMGLRGAKDTQGPVFGRDVLRIEHHGHIGLHLSVVDLPGLIANATEDQTEEDVATVHDLVDTYLQNPRTIILAVVQAGNDIANQGIIKKARTHDQLGTRTVGIITKPDLVNRGTENSIAILARNESTTRLNLGFFLLKNPSPEEIKTGMTTEQREQAEIEYFRRVPWKSHALDMERVGIVNLRNYLQLLLDQHIESELPKVRDEIQKLLVHTEQDITSLGEERPTIENIRTFLSRLAMRFHAIVKAASHGDYHSADSTFFASEDDGSTSTKLRLRALIHNMNTQFSDEMQAFGASWKVGGRNIEFGSQVSNPYHHLKTGQLVRTEEQMKAFVLRLYRATRGRELPGDYNHIFLTELFHSQSSRWESFATVLLDSVMERLTVFVRDVTAHLIPEDRVRNGLARGIEDTLASMRKAAEEELGKLCADKDEQPITYNHYYTDTVQKARHDGLRSSLEAALVNASGSTFDHKLDLSDPSRMQSIVDSLQKRVQVNMDEQACSQAREALDAYYKVARKTFVDNVTVQVIERHLLRPLPNLFTPEIVAAMPDDELKRIGGESEHTMKKRKELQLLRKNLAASLEELRKDAVTVIE